MQDQSTSCLRQKATKGRKMQQRMDQGLRRKTVIIIFHTCPLSASDRHSTRLELYPKTHGDGARRYRLGSLPVRQRYILHRTITKWKPKHLHIVSSQKSLYQSTFCLHSHFEIAIASPILMRVNEPRSIQPRRPYKILMVWYIGETISIFTLSRQQLAQSALVIHFSSTPYER